MSLGDFIKDVFSDSLIYGASKAVTVLAGLITLPILSRFLSVEEIGFFDFYNTIIVLVSSLAFFGLDSVYGMVISGKSEVKEHRGLESSIIVILMIGVSLAFVLMLLLEEYIGVDMEALWLYFLLVLPSNILVMFYSNKAKWKREKTTYLFITIGRSFLVLFGVLLLSYSHLLSFQTYLILNVLFRLLILVALFFRGFIELEIPALQTISDLYRLSSYLGLIAVLYSALPFLERYLILNWLSSAELGRYTIMLKCASLLLIIATIFNTMWGPLSLQLKLNGNYMRKIFVMTIAYLYVLGVVIIGAYSDFILGFLVPGYDVEMSIKEIHIISLNTAVLSINNLIETDYLRLHRTSSLFKVHISTLLLGYFLSFFVDRLIDLLLLYSIVYSLRLLINTLLLYVYDRVLYSSIIPIVLAYLFIFNRGDDSTSMSIEVLVLIIFLTLNFIYAAINPKFKKW